MKVLIVDDERDIRDSLEEFFRDEGFDVATAANGEEAMKQLTAPTLPCAMLLDLFMPVLGGVEVYGRMQADERLKNVPVIISTSDPSRAPSGVLIMKKPIDLNRLLLVVKQHCDTAAKV
jgi:two-component system, sensor histidine kinase and response regulator